MSNYKIYYNAKCGTCRNTLGVLKEHGIEPELVEYIKLAPSREELVKLCKLLGKNPIEITRVARPQFKALGLDPDELSDDEVLDILVEHPEMIERPIVVRDGERAVIARPAENVLALVD